MLKTMNFLFALVLVLAVVGCQQDSNDPISSNDFSGSSLSKVTVNPDGTGFVGKGDVQYTFGWNNNLLQQNANSVAFRISSSSVTEYSWTCDRDAGPQTQERSNVKTTSIQGLFESVARERNQITGFILNGFDGNPIETVEEEGPAVGSCPTGWTAIDLTETTTPGEGGGIEVSALGFDWTTLLEKPVL